MLIRNVILEKIRAGEISLVFRKWRKATVKKGGTQMTRLGVLGIDAIDIVSEKQISESSARAAGFASKKELLEDLRSDLRDGDLYRIKVHYIGADPRIALRASADLGADELSTIRGKLSKMDASSKRGPWTRHYLQMIKDQPQTHAIILARSVGLDNLTFKPQVRRLKALGLTESLRPGYRLSPRGEKVLEAMSTVSTKPAKTRKPAARSVTAKKNK